MLKRLVKTGLFAVVGVGCLSARLGAQEVEARNLAAYYPGSTIFYASVENLAGSCEVLKKTAPGRIWQEPEMQEFLAEPVSRLADALKKFEAATGFKPADLKQCFSERASIGLVMQPTERDEAALVFIARLSDAETGPRIIRSLPGLLKNVVPPGALRGTTVNPELTSVIPLGGAKLSVALHEGHLFVVVDDHATTMPKLLGGLGGATLAADGVFSATASHLGPKPQFGAYLNLGIIYDLLAREAKRDVDLQQAMGIAGLLGLFEIKGVGCSVSAEPPGFANRLFIHAPAPRKGLLTLLKTEPVSDKLLAAVPANAVTFSALKLDLGGIPKLVRRLAAQSGMDPAMMDEVLNHVQAQFGFHPEKDVLEQLGDEVALVFVSPSAVGGLPIFGLNGTALVVRHRNQKPIATAMATITMLGGTFAREIPWGGGVVQSVHRGYQLGGVQIANVVAPSYAVTEELLIIGAGPQVVKVIIDAVAGKAPRVTSTEDYRAAMKRLGEGDRCCVTYARKGTASTVSAGAAPLGMMGVMSGLMLPALSRAREQARRAQCMSNLKQFGLAINMYAQDHNESFPKDLTELVTDGYVADRNLFACPSNPGSGYEYIPGLKTTDPAGSVVMFDSADNHGGEGRNALYIDGHVTWYAGRDFQRELAKTRRYLKNRGRAAAVRAYGPRGNSGARRAGAMPPLRATGGGPFALLKGLGGNPDALIRELLGMVPLYKAPPASCIDRHMFASSGRMAMDDDGLLYEGHGPMPFANGGGGGGGAAIGAGLPGIAVIAAIAIPNLLRSKMAANESAAIAAMRTYCGAQNIFHRTDYDADAILEYCCPGQQGAARDHVSFTFLNTTRVGGQRIELIDGAFARAKLGAPGAMPKAGYYFIDIEKDSRGNRYNSAFSYGLCAVPAQYNRTGLNTFIVDVQGTVFQRDNGGEPVTQFPNTNDPNEPWIVCE